MKSLAEAELFAVGDEIRNHLLAPGHSPRKWTIPSLTDDPRRAVTIVASRDLGEPGGEYAQAFHLSLGGWVDEEQVELPAKDLDELAPLILDFLAPFAYVRGGGSNPFAKDSSKAVHVWVYFASNSLADPLTPTGPYAVTPARRVGSVRDLGQPDDRGRLVADRLGAGRTIEARWRRGAESGHGLRLRSPCLLSRWQRSE